MITADPTVPDALNGQAWNRYSYVGNDPLTFIDPSGFSWLSDFFHNIGSFFRTVFNLVLRYVVQAVLTVVLSSLGPIAPFLAAAAAAAVVTGVNGGNLGAMLRSAAITFATTVAFNVVGSATNAVAGYDPSGKHITPEFGTPAYAFNVAGHAGVGCVAAVASGGKCGPGALSAAAGAAAAPLVSSNPIVGTVESGLVGGLASVAGGGKFEDGAVTAAFGYMFNSMWRSREAVPFIDDRGNAVLDWSGQQMMRPSDVDPHFFVDAAINGPAFGLSSFGQGGAWDVQRVGPELTQTDAFVDFSTVAIGIYGAARGIPLSVLLWTEDQYAAVNSNFRNAAMDDVYTHLPQRNVWNTAKGYELFRKGFIGPSPSN